MRTFPIVRAVLLTLCLVLVVATAHAEPTRRLAVQARFDLEADQAVGAVSAGHAVDGFATVERMVWRPAAEHPRGYTVKFPISPFHWRSLAFRFTPRGAGKVTLLLSAPWDKDRGGEPYRQEVCWDAIGAEGAELANGGFEQVESGRPTGWEPRGGRLVAADAGLPAAEGTHLVRCTERGLYAAVLTVAADKPVTLRLSARSVPSDAPAMRPAADRRSPAHEAAQRFRRGVNFSNYLEAPPGQDWGMRYDRGDFAAARREGFDHVRLPVGWQNHTGPGPDFKLRAEIFRLVDPLVEAAVAERLSLIVNVHHFDALTTRPADERARFVAIWRQIAEHYAGVSELVAFELLNEPFGAATSEVMSPIYAEAIREIRRTHPGRPIFIGPGQWNQAAELWRLALPDDDRNLIASVHCYDPFFFTHQGASWTGPETRTTGIVFPGPPRAPLDVPAAALSAQAREVLERYNTLPAAVNPAGIAALASAAANARAWSDHYGRPVHCGEFGCYEKADLASRVNYYRAARQVFERADVGWAIWDWKAGFRYWDRAQKATLPGMREALFERGG